MTDQNETNLFRKMVSFIQARKLWPYLIVLLILLIGVFLIFRVGADSLDGLSDSAFPGKTNTPSGAASATSGEAGVGTLASPETSAEPEGTPTITQRPTSTDEFQSRFKTLTPTTDYSSTATNTPFGWTASPTKTPTATATSSSTPLTVQIDLTANPTSLDEPGGLIQYQVEVENTYSRPVEVVSLTDSKLADLSGKGTCDSTANPYPTALAAGDSYTCSFSVNFLGDSDDSYANTVTVQVEDAEGRKVIASDYVSVTILDVLPTLTVSKVASEASVIEPGGIVSFTVEVLNTSVEQVRLIQLLDDQAGNLNDVGTCETDVLIATGAVYTCEYSANVSGVGGDTYTNTISARVIDNEYNGVTDTATASVQILPAVTSVISGQVRFDQDGDGNMTDPDPGLEGVRIELEDISCTPGLDCPVEVTDSNGRYSFSGVVAGSYFIVAADLPDYYSTNDSLPPNDNQIPLTVAAGVDYPNNDFLDATCPGPTDPINGYVSSTTPENDAIVSISINSVRVQFDQPMSQSGSGSVLLIDNYNLGLNNLSNGGMVPFTSVVYNPASYEVTLVFDNTDPDWQPGSSYEFQVLSETENSCGTPQGFDVVRSFSTMSSISGQVREDADGDGDLDDLDAGISGVTIELDDGACLVGNTCQKAVTDSAGEYVFTDLAAGDYTIRETDLDGYDSTNDQDGGDFNVIIVKGLSASELLSGMDFLDKEICPSPHPVTGFVSFTIPSDGATGVVLSANRITVVFNQPMDTFGPGSVTDVRNYSLLNISNGRNVCLSSADYNSLSNTVNITVNTSSNNWIDGDWYQFTIQSEVQNSCLVSQAVDVVIDFRTAQ